MKAVIVLLADYETQNKIRKVVFELDSKYGIDFLAARLPAHISLKQPFNFENMDTLEKYAEQLAANLAPVKIEPGEIYYADWGNSGILGINIKETKMLRSLHEKLNRELAELFINTSAPFDGDEYKFHITIEMGATVSKNPYKEYFERLNEKKVIEPFTAKSIGIFYAGSDPTSFINYRIIPLRGNG